MKRRLKRRMRMRMRMRMSPGARASRAATPPPTASGASALADRSDFFYKGNTKAPVN